MLRRSQTNRSRGNRNQPRVMAMVNRRLKEMHVNQAATWHLNKTRSFDPPPYVEDVLYQRKVRLAAELTSAQIASYTPANILAAAGLPVGSFQFLTVLRADFYGQAAAVNGIRVSSFIISGSDIIPDRDFEDYGIQGARRPHISISISPKDQGFVETSSTSTIFQVTTVNQSGTVAPGSLIADFFVQFKNTAAAVREGRKSVRFDLSSSDDTELTEIKIDPKDDHQGIDQGNLEDLLDYGKSDMATAWSSVPRAQLTPRPGGSDRPIQ